MRIAVAIRAFLKAFKNPKETQEWLSGKSNKEESSEAHAHLRLLSLLQHSSRLVDFLKEEITSFSDAQIGAAVRQVHADSAKSLEELVAIRPLLDEIEGNTTTVPVGYDPSCIKVIGKVKGEPPFKGVVRHRGWKAHKLSLPKQVGQIKKDVIAPAEVEING